MYYFLGAQPILVITYVSDGKRNFTRFGSFVFGDKIMGQIIKDLLAINSLIQLDDYAKAILVKASDSVT
jgi:hypothetical protein